MQLRYYNSDENTLSVCSAASAECDKSGRTEPPYADRLWRMTIKKSNSISDAYTIVTGGAGFIGADFVNHWRNRHFADGSLKPVEPPFTESTKYALNSTYAVSKASDGSN